MQLWSIENNHLTILINIFTMKNYIFIPLFIWMAFFLPKQLMAQLPSQPDFEIMQNGHSNPLFNQKIDLSRDIVELDVSHYAPGFYILNITLPSGELKSFKFIKQ